MQKVASGINHAVWRDAACCIQKKSTDAESCMKMQRGTASRLVVTINIGTRKGG